MTSPQWDIHELTFAWDPVVARWPLGVEAGAQIEVVFLTFRDAAKSDVGLRVPASARVLQGLADQVSGVLMTPRMLDWRYRAANRRVPPVFSDSNGTIAAAMTVPRYHAAVEERLALAEELEQPNQIVEGIGKSWVLCKAVGTGRFGVQTAYNYGWHTNQAFAKGQPTMMVGQGILVAQGLGGMHNLDHVDPSQAIYGIAYEWVVVRRAGLTWELPLVHALADADLAPILSHEGPLQKFRYSVVPEHQSQVREEGHSECRSLLWSALDIVRGD